MGRAGGQLNCQPPACVVCYRLSMHVLLPYMPAKDTLRANEGGKYATIRMARPVRRSPERL